MESTQPPRNISSRSNFAAAMPRVSGKVGSLGPSPPAGFDVASALSTVPEMVSADRARPKPGDFPDRFPVEWSA